MGKFDLRNLLTFNTATDPTEILSEVAPDEVPSEAPPASANYRPVEIKGTGCAFCTKFRYTGVELDDEGGMVPTGVCDLYEASVRGDHISDGYAESGPPLNTDGEEVWDFADDQRVMAEIHMSNSAPMVEKDGLVEKEILRTGEWDVIPTGAGLIKKPLKIIRDGVSNYDEGIIALSEVEANFRAQAVPNVEVILSDAAKDDHAITQNRSKLTQGFVRDLFIRDQEDGTSKLVAKVHFTEPEAKDKALRGTYADCSAGIPWTVFSRGKKFGPSLEHVCITNSPFIDNLGPWLAASDQAPSNINITHIFLSDTSATIEEVEVEPEPEEVPDEQTTLSYSEQVAAVQEGLLDQHGLNQDYAVIDIRGSAAVIENKISGTVWTAPFEIKEGSAVVTAPQSWEKQNKNAGDVTPEQSSSAPRTASDDDSVEAARIEREIRLSNIQPTNQEAANTMPRLTREELEALNLSDEQRAAFQSVLDENQTLAASQRTSEIDARVTELRDDIGIKVPGALKFYRDLALSDDGGPAVVLMSDKGEKERVSAKEILDRFIDTLVVDGKIQFSDQHIDPGHDDPAPPVGDGPQLPVAERVAAAKAELKIS